MNTAVRRFACGLSAGLVLAAAPAGAEVVDVPTAGGGMWQMMIAPQGTTYDHPAVLRVAMQRPEEPAAKEVPDPIAIPDPPASDTPADAAQPADEPEPPSAEGADSSDAPMPLPEAPPAPAADGPTFGMTILPQSDGPSAADAAKQYAAVYRSIPFNRAEYVANPGYRHDATMELLTGNQRLTAGYTGKTLALPKPGVYRPYLPSRREYLTAPFPYFGGAGFSGVGYGGIGNGGFSYTGPAAYGLGALGTNAFVNPVLGGYGGFINTGFGFGGNRLFGLDRLGRGASAFGGRPANNRGMRGGAVGMPVMPTPAD